MCLIKIKITPVTHTKNLNEIHNEVAIYWKNKVEIMSWKESSLREMVDFSPK